MTTRYEERGVSAAKPEVHAAIAGLNKGLYPGAFCTILPDVAGDKEFCFAMHADGSGTKAALAYLAWKHGADIRVFRGIATDSKVMNADDLACVGAARSTFHYTQTINRNKFLVPGEVLRELVKGSVDFTRKMQEYGISMVSAGGETADVPDTTRTLNVDDTMVVRFPRRHVIDASRIVEGDIIIGFSSTGQAKWEDEPNSGIGSNGLTNARHDVLSPDYREDFETFAPQMNPSLVYRGTYHLDDELPGDNRFSIGSALLSPTRTYLPLVEDLMGWVGPNLHALIHCSGGGQTKIGKFGGPGLLYIKDGLFPTPPLFTTLQQASNLPWREMYQSYNMGHRLEAVVPRHAMRACIDVAHKWDIDAREVGWVSHNDSPTKNRVAVRSPENIGKSYSYLFDF